MVMKSFNIYVCISRTQYANSANPCNDRSLTKARDRRNFPRSSSVSQDHSASARRETTTFVAREKRSRFASRLASIPFPFLVRRSEMPPSRVRAKQLFARPSSRRWKRSQGHAVPRTVAVLLGGSLVGRWVALSKSRAEQQSPRQRVLNPRESRPAH